jgi:phospholipase B1
MTPEGRSKLREVQLGYYYGMRDLIDSGRYDDKDNFTVVLQPHLRDQKPFIDVGLTLLI